MYNIHSWENTEMKFNGTCIGMWNLFLHIHKSPFSSLVNIMRRWNATLCDTTIETKNEWIQKYVYP